MSCPTRTLDSLSSMPMRLLPMVILGPLWISIFGLCRPLENADAVLRALRRFGAPLHDLTKKDLQKDGTIFQIGVAPRRIDIITAASGLQFEVTYRDSTPVNIEGIEVRIPSIDHLILNKRASGRTKDLADAEALEFLKNPNGME